MSSNSPRDWRESILGFQKPSEQGQELRHSLRFVKASDIAEQYYCEVKLDLGYTRGTVPSDAKIEGERIHESAFVMEAAKPQKVVSAIETLKRVAATFTVYGKVGMLTIVGRPDAIAFQDGKPRWVIELKTTNKNPAKLWTNQVVQVKTYGLLL